MDTINCMIANKPAQLIDRLGEVRNACVRAKRQMMRNRCDFFRKQHGVEARACRQMNMASRASQSDNFPAYGCFQPTDIEHLGDDKQ